MESIQKSRLAYILSWWSNSLVRPVTSVRPSPGFIGAWRETGPSVSAARENFWKCQQVPVLLARGDLAFAAITHSPAPFASSVITKRNPFPGQISFLFFEAVAPRLMYKQIRKSPLGKFISATTFFFSFFFPFFFFLFFFFFYTSGLRGKPELEEDQTHSRIILLIYWYCARDKEVWIYKNSLLEELFHVLEK